MAKRMLISAARKQLFDLFDEVVANSGRRVVIGRRDVTSEAVLIGLNYVEQLERARPGSSTFKLQGSARALTSPELLVEELRAPQAQHWREKLRTFSSKKVKR